MNKYIKSHSKELTFYEALQMLTQMKEQGLLQSDPNLKDNVLIYRAAGDNGDPEGWYSENIFSVAEDLLNDYESQQALWRVLEEHSFEPEFEPKWWEDYPEPRAKQEERKLNMENTEKYVIYSSDISEIDNEDFYNELVAEGIIDPEITKYGSDEWYDYLCEDNNFQLEDERMNLCIQTENDIIAIADLGLWNGRRMAYKEVGDNVNACLQSYVNGMSELEVYVENGELKASESHHDGTNNYTFREYKSDISDDDKEDFKDMLYNGTATLKDMDKYTMPMGHYAAEVFGWEISDEKNKSEEQKPKKSQNDIER